VSVSIVTPPTPSHRCAPPSCSPPVEDQTLTLATLKKVKLDTEKTPDSSHLPPAPERRLKLRGSQQRRHRKGDHPRPVFEQGQHGRWNRAPFRNAHRAHPRRKKGGYIESCHRHRSSSLKHSNRSVRPALDALVFSGVQRVYWCGLWLGLAWRRLTFVLHA
jgi:hypothetical protein